MKPTKKSKVKQYLVVIQYSEYIEATSEEEAREHIQNRLSNGDIETADFEITAEED